MTTKTKNSSDTVNSEADKNENKLQTVMLHASLHVGIMNPA